MLLNVVGTLSSMLKTAQYWGYICEGIRFHKLVLPERAITRPSRFFTADQVRAILAGLQGWHRVMIAIAATTGLRIGEILALKVSDFDFERKLLTVYRSVWRGKLSTPKPQPAKRSCLSPIHWYGSFVNTSRRSKANGFS
jgi:integrase